MRLSYLVPTATEADRTRFRRFWASLQHDAHVVEGQVIEGYAFDDGSEATRILVELRSNEEGLNNRGLAGEMYPFLEVPGRPSPLHWQPTVWDRLLKGPFDD